MAEALTWAAAALLLNAAFALLALLQERHRERVWAACELALRPVLATLSVALLMLGSLLLCVETQGMAFGVLAWITLSNLAALATALCLAWCPMLLRPLLWACRRRQPLASCTPPRRVS
jgi:Protein of unknown function (DUF3325)